MNFDFQSILDPYSPSQYSHIIRGFSADWREITEKVRLAVFDREAPSSHEFGELDGGRGLEAAFQDLEEIGRGSSHDNWDGFGATAISGSTLAATERFLRQLPSYFPVPELNAEPDGDINLEWYAGNDYIFEISVNRDDWLFYAGRIRGKKITGKLKYEDAFPEELREILLANWKRS